MLVPLEAQCHCAALIEVLVYSSTDAAVRRSAVKNKNEKKVTMIKCTAGSGLLEVGDPQHGRAEGATALLEFCSGN